MEEVYTEIKFLSRSESFGVDSWYQERGILFEDDAPAVPDLLFN